MANFTERIKIVIDVVGDKATSQLKGFRQAVAEAEGVTGKFKAGMKSVGASLTAFASSPTAMAGAATAAAAAVGKLVSNAMDLSLAVGDLAAKTGMTAEESSRWLEVTGDLGIETDAVAGALKKMSVAMDPEVFASYGIEIAKTASGTTDMSATLLNVIDRLHNIQDPAERARVATKLLGKNWQELAQLIEAGGSQIKTRLDEVAGAKIVDQQKIEEARQLRDAIDGLRDAGDELALELGQTILPQVTDAFKAIGDAANLIPDGWAAKAADAFLGYVNPIKGVKDLWDWATTPEVVHGKFEDWASQTFEAFRKTSKAGQLGIKTYQDYLAALKAGTLTQQDSADAINEHGREQATAMSMYGEYTRSLIGYHNELSGTTLSEREAAATKDALARSAQAAAVAIDLERTANDNLLNGLDDNLANLNIITFFDDLPGRLAEIKRQYETGKIDARRYWLETAKELEGAKQKLADYLINVKGLDADYVMTLLADVTGAEGDIDRVLGKVAKYEKDRKVFLERNGVAIGQDATGGYASGVTLVGEQGPELVDLPGGSTVYNRVATGRLLGSINQPASLAAVSNVTVNVMSADPQAVVGAIKKYTARGGQV